MLVFISRARDFLGFLEAGVEMLQGVQFWGLLCLAYDLGGSIGPNLLTSLALAQKCPWLPIT